MGKTNAKRETQENAGMAGRAIKKNMPENAGMPCS